MPLDFSSDCDCPNCLEALRNEPDWNSCASKSDYNSLYSKSRKKSVPSASVQCFPSQCCSNRPDNDTKENSVFLPSEEKSYVASSPNKHLILNSEATTRKPSPPRELTVQELLRDFDDNWKFQPHSMSVGHFRDQVVMKFRRALYYSGIWVTHVQGYKHDKHFTAHYFKRNPGCLQRLVPWLKRELTAVYGDYDYTVKNILDTILHHMTEYDLDSESFIHLLEPYLQQYTHHFLHEFISFVHSPYNLETYDQRAIYEYPAASPWVKKKSRTSVPVLPLPKEQALLSSQHDTGQSKSSQKQWNNEERPLSGLKLFPNGNSSLKKPETPRAYHKTTSKSHAWVKGKSESGDHNGTIPANNTLLHWVTSRQKGPGLQSYKKHVQERKIKGHVQDLGKGKTSERPFSTPSVFNQEQPMQYSPRERKILSLDHQINCQKKAAETSKSSNSSPNIFQRMPRKTSLISDKSRKRDPSWSCISEIALSPKTDGRKMTSLRKKRMKCRESSQFAEVSHSSRRIQRQQRFNTHRSKSWCVRHTKRPVSRDSSNLSLKGSHSSECFTKNVCYETSRGNYVDSYESVYGKASSTSAQYGKLSLTGGKRPNYSSKNEGTSQVGNHCTSPTSLQIEKHRSSSKQEMKQRNTFPIARKTRVIRHQKNKCQCPDVQTTEEFSDELGDLNDTKQMSSLSNCISSCRRQTQKQKNLSLQKHYQAKNEHKGNKSLETQRCKFF